MVKAREANVDDLSVHEPNHRVGHHETLPEREKDSRQPGGRHSDEEARVAELRTWLDRC